MESKHIHLKEGDRASEPMWCYQQKAMRSLRVGIEKCEGIKIERDHLRKLNDELVETQTYHDPIWMKWWVRLPVAMAVGGLTASWVESETDSSIAAGILGGALGGATVLAFEF